MTNVGRNRYTYRTVQECGESGRERVAGKPYERKYISYENDIRQKRRRAPGACCGAGNDFRQPGLFQVEAGTAFGRTPADLY